MFRQRGLWTYSVENRADSHQGLYIQVTAKRNSSLGLQVRLWTSSGSRPINSSDPSTPVVIYAEVKAGVAPIMDARVVATLQRLGSNATGSNYPPIFLDLWDNGIGGEHPVQSFSLLYQMKEILIISPLSLSLSLSFNKVYRIMVKEIWTISPLSLL